MRQLDCLFVGSATHDILMLVEEPPQSDMRIAASRVAIAGGGPASTAGVAFTRLGGSAGLVSAVGEDPTGQVILEDLRQLGFDYLEVRRLPGEKSAMSTIQVEKNGKRCITAYGGCIQALRFEEVNKEALHHARYVHLAGPAEQLLLPMARYLKENTDALVSVDGGNYTRAFTEAILPYTDIFIPDDKTAQKTLGLSPRDACLAYAVLGPGIVCVTRGPEGSIAYDGKTFYEADALTVQVVDTTGAGDNFHGAFLYALAQGWALPKVQRFASVFSSLTCTGLGGREAIPNLETVLARL